MSISIHSVISTHNHNMQHVPLSARNVKLSNSKNVMPITLDIKVQFIEEREREYNKAPKVLEVPENSRPGVRTGWSLGARGRVFSEKIYLRVPQTYLRAKSTYAYFLAFVPSFL